MFMVGCPDDRAELIVEVRTDFVPGAEFTEARVELSLTPRLSGSQDLVDREAMLVNDDDGAFLQGVRVAELTTDPGTRWVFAELLAADGEVVARRAVQVEVTANMAIVVVLTRDCVNVECPAPGGDPALLACLGGQCVDPRCRPGATEFCPASVCGADSDCADIASCAAARCIEGTCYAATIDGACSGDEWCNPERGCMGMEEPMCRRVLCDVANECEIGLRSCDGTDECVSAGVAYNGTACTEGTCDGSGACRGFLVNILPSGGGTIVSDPEGINCGEDCSARFTRGASLIVEAVPDVGSRFVEWVDPPCVVDGATCTVAAVESDLSLEATFAADIHSVTITPSPGGRVLGLDGSIDCGFAMAVDGPPGPEGCTAEVEYGSMITLTAAPVEGNVFDRWGGDCADAGTSPTCDLMVTGDISLNAGFMPAPPETFVVTIARPETGLVTSDTEEINCGEVRLPSGPPGPFGDRCTAEVRAGAPIELSVEPAFGFDFVSWGGACEFAGSAPTCRLIPSADSAVTVSFRATPPATGTITVTPSEGGTVISSDERIECGSRCSSVYRDGVYLELEAVPDDGFTFSRWVGPCEFGKGPEEWCEHEVDGDARFQAIFEEEDIGCTLSARLTGGFGSGRITGAGLNCGSGGSGTCSVVVPCGSTAALNVVGLDGEFVDWRDPICSESGDGPFCFIESIDGDYEVIASLEFPSS